MKALRTATGGKWLARIGRCGRCGGISGVGGLAAGLAWVLSTGLLQAAPGPTTAPTPTLSRSVKLPPSPVDYFRQLLSAVGEDRERLLGARKPEEHPKFRAFLKEYEGCTPEERERRLQALELRFLITSILRLPAEARAEAVERLPDAARDLVRARLDYWKQLAPDVQQAMLENERLMRIVAFVSAGYAGTARTPGTNQLGRLESAVRSWNNLPEEKRVAAEAAFRHMFDPAPPRPVIAVQPLTAAETAEMERVLQRFKHLSAAQRSRCVRNFSKLAEMPPAERAAFLRSAEEWQRLSPEDREAWKNLVKRAPVFPPLPPGFRTPPLPVLRAGPGWSGSTN